MKWASRVDLGGSKMGRSRSYQDTESVSHRRLPRQARDAQRGNPGYARVERELTGRDWWSVAVVQRGCEGPGQGDGRLIGDRSASAAHMQSPHTRPWSSPEVSLVPSWMLATATNCYRMNRGNGEVEI
jgi:hypothetical protein